MIARSSHVTLLISLYNVNLFRESIERALVISSLTKDGRKVVQSYRESKDYAQISLSTIFLVRHLYQTSTIGSPSPKIPTMNLNILHLFLNPMWHLNVNQTRYIPIPSTSAMSVFAFS